MPQTKTQAGGKKARLLWYFLRGSKRFYLAAVLCSVCITFLDMLTPQLIRITIDNVLGQLPLNVPAFLEPAWLRLGGVEALRTHLWWIALAVIAIALVIAFFRYGNMTLTTKASETFVRTMRNDLFAHIQRLPFSWHMKNQTGDIIQRCTSDVDMIRNFVTEQLVQLFRVAVLLVLGLGFSALAVPLALDLSWTTCTWALQGLGLIWLGLRQKRPLLRFLGYALQLLAATTFMDLFSLRELISLPGGLLDNRMACGLVMTLAALLLVHFCSRHRNVLGRQEREMLLPWQIWAMIWWLGTGLNILSGFLDVQEQLFANAALVFTVLSCVLWVRIGTRLSWRAFAAAGHLLLPALLLSQWRFLPDLALLPFLPLRPPPAVSPLAWSHGGLAALPLAWASFVFCLRSMPWPSSGDRYRKIVANAVLLSVPGLLLPAANHDLGRLPLLGPAWSLLLLTILAAAFLFLLRRGSRLPVLSGPADPVRWSGLVLSLVLVCWFCLFCALPGAAAPLPYIPLLGPLDMAQSLCLLACLYWLRGMRHTGFPPERLYRGLLAGFGAGAFALCTVVAARAVSWYAYCPYTAAALVRSPVFQAVLSVLWGSIALGLVLTASRVFRQRKLWFAGAALLGLTLCKLLLFDLADHQTVYRIISFLFLGLLMLGMGYFCPLPPKRREEASEQNSSPAP